MRHSTGKLTPDQIKQQDARYEEKHSYDYLILGTGMSALTIGSLLANAGFRVCMLEAHDIPGGYAHSFEMNDYHFCAEIHYIWGCAPGQRIYEFVKHLGLEEEITFNSMDPEGFDQVVLPDGKRVKIPNGFDKLIDNIAQHFPDQRQPLQKFVNILNKISDEMGKFPNEGISKWQYITQGYKFLTLLKYKNKTLQNVFDECRLSVEAQAVLSATSGDFMSPPEELSIFAFVGLFYGYNEGAYYPTKHFKHFINRIAQFITDHSGCHIFYETMVTNITADKSGVTNVTSSDGKLFSAPKIICNIDPQTASKLIGRENFPKKFLEQLSYEYSPSSVMIYMGLKGIDLRDYGFGNHNTWHLEQWSMNNTWKELRNQNTEKPWIAISTPTLHAEYPGVAPDGCHIMELITAGHYATFKELSDKDPKEYRKEKRKQANHLLDIIEEKYIPTIRKHIAVKVVGTPTTNEDFCLAPRGNSYGSHLTPHNMGLNRLKSTTPWDNFFWCNASSGYGGVYGTVLTGMDLYMKLTGDYFFNPLGFPTTEEAINYAKKRVHQPSSQPALMDVDELVAMH